MILNQLVLHNVGTFAGRQVIDLTPESENKPIVVIGGLNGAGKTTILEAIQLALYGSLSNSSARRTGSYENYLRGLIHRGVPASEGAAIELNFTAYQEGKEKRYWILRSWKVSGNSVREILLVSVDGRHDSSLTSTWNEHIETFLPRGIAGLFFFDGEQIEALADLDRSRQVLGSALAALLGLDLVDRLSTDLTVLKRRHRGERVPEELREEVEEKRRLVTAQRQAEEAASEATAARFTEFERCQKIFHEANEAYRAAGGDLLERREASEAEAASVRSGLADVEDDLRHQLAELTPLLQLPVLLDQLVTQVHAEANAKRDALLVEAFALRDAVLVQKLMEANVEALTVADVANHLASDRAERRASSEINEIIGVVGNQVGLEALVFSALPEARKRLQTAVARRAELRTALDQAERVLAAIPDPESLAPLGRAREEARDALIRAEATYALATEILAKAAGDRAKAMTAYESALDKATHANLAADDDRRLVEHVDRVRDTLENLKLAATKKHLGRISQLVMEALSVLLRKQRLVTEVTIDPDTYTVSLTGADGHVVPARILSAGERQLLAVALLWGLARASGQPLPVVIDTPLGRLDGSHREHLLDRYFPSASHQVVLLSTDTEIDEEALNRIAPFVGRIYHLRFDAELSATRVDTGYF